jgi:hypothetical protein
MNMQMKTLFVSIFAVAAAPSCVLFGGREACSPSDPATCPSGTVCNADNFCVPGTGPAGEGEGERDTGEGEGETPASPGVIVDNTRGAVFFRIKDNVVYWAESTDGGCVRFRDVTSDAAPTDIQCAPGRVMAMALGQRGLLWARDDGTADQVYSAPYNTPDPDIDTLTPAGGEDIGSLLDSGTSMLASLANGGDELLLWPVHNAPDADGNNSLYRYTGRSIADGTVFITFVRETTNNVLPLVSVVGLTSLATIAMAPTPAMPDGVYTYVPASPTSALITIDVDFIDGALPSGSPVSIVTDGVIAYVGLKTSNGGQLVNLQNIAEERDCSEICYGETTASVDPSGASVYPFALDVDGLYVYYTTAGGAGPYAVIRARKDDPTVQEIIAELPAAGGVINVVGDKIYWAEPTTNRIVAIDKP